MKRFLALLLLSGCPYDAEAAGLTAVDGGYVYGEGDASIFIPAVDAEVPERLPNAPTMNQLCTLYVGDALDQTDYPRRVGLWIEDVRRIFGEPPRNGIVLGKNEAKLSYLWSGGTDASGDVLEPSGMTLSFEYLPLNNLLLDDDGEFEGFGTQVLSNSYFLNGIQMRDGVYHDCWRWELREPGLQPCTQCQLDRKKWGNCTLGAGNPTECF